MALTFVAGRKLVFVLDEENVERIRENDPFEFDMAKTGMVVALPIPFQVVVAYARKDEQPIIAELAKSEDKQAVLDYLYRGFKITASDHQRTTPYKTW